MGVGTAFIVNARCPPGDGIVRSERWESQLECWQRQLAEQGEVAKSSKTDKKTTWQGESKKRGLPHTLYNNHESPARIGSTARSRVFEVCQTTASNTAREQQMKNLRANISNSDGTFIKGKQKKYTPLLRNMTVLHLMFQSRIGHYCFTEEEGFV